MLQAILGIKKRQTQIFTEDGMRHAVTQVEAGPCWICAIDKTDRYTNIQLGFGSKKAVNKPIEGQLKKAGLTQKLRFFRSIRVDSIPEDWTVGKEVKIADIFAIGDIIRVTGVSKGKGFAGVVKRHGFAGGPKTHGQSDRERAPGSIGSTTTPGRVYRGKRMAGRMGSDTVTVRGLKVMSMDAEKNTMLVSGLIPGPKDTIVTIAKG